MTEPARRGAWNGVAACLVALGALARALHAYPPHEFPNGADSYGTGLKALAVLHGHTPVFYADARLGAFESYLHAAAFAAFGISRASMALAPLLVGVLTLAAFWLLVRSLLGPPLGALALLFFALASPAYLFWTYLPIGYAESMLFGTAALWMAERIRRSGASPLASFGLGLAGGLGFWNSILTLAFFLPALAWLPWRRRRLAADPRFLASIALGFAVGAAPWIAYNVRHPLASLENNFAARPVSRAGQLLANPAYLATYSLPELVASTDPENGVNPPSRLQTLLRPAVLAIHAAAALLVAGSLAAWARSRKTSAPGWVLLLAVAGTNLFFAVVSDAGDMRGLTVRYVLPVYVLVAAALALLLAAAWRLWRPLAIVLGLVCLVFDVAGYSLPGKPMRRRLEGLARDEDRLVELLSQRRVDAVLGDYWDVYSINFFSRERVLGIASQPGFDFNRYAERLAPGMRWALVSRDRTRLESWARRAGAAGSVVPVGVYSTFLPAAPALSGPAGPFLERMRAAYAAALPAGS